MVYIPIKSYGPDADPTTQGVIKDGRGWLPTNRGLQAISSPVNSDLPTATATAVAGASLEDTDGTLRTFICTPTQILEGASNTWTDRTGDASGSATVLPTTTTCRFAQFRDTALAAPNSAQMMSSATGVFTPVSGAPTCTVIEVVNNQVMCLNIITSGFGSVAAAGDRWWCSALGTFSDFNPSIATQAASGRLSSTPGEFVGGKRLGNDFVAYKSKSMYLGRYAGPPTIWDWFLVSDAIGAISHESIVPVGRTGTGHYFVGEDDFWFFDGARPRPIGQPVRDEFFVNEMNKSNRQKTVGVFSPRNEAIFWFYPSVTGDGTLDRAITYHIPTGEWGTPWEQNVQTAFFFVRSTGVTYNNLGNLYATYNDLPMIQYDDPFWGTREEGISIVNSSALLQTLNGNGVATRLNLFDIGTDGQYSFLTRVRPRFAEYPTTATLVNSYSDNLSDTVTSSGATMTLNNGKFDVEREARWHHLRMNTTGSVELLGFDIELQGAGSE